MLNGALIQLSLTPAGPDPTFVVETDCEFSATF